MAAACSHGERGHALLLATVLGIVAMSAWALAFLTTRDLIRTEKVVAQRAERDASVTRALAHALELLRTGLPPDQPYECVYAFEDGEQKHQCTLVYSKDEDTGHWTVEARCSTETELGMLPDAPESFDDDDS